MQKDVFKPMLLTKSDGVARQIWILREAGGGEEGGVVQEAASQNAWRDYDVREDVRRRRRKARGLKNNEKLSPTALAAKASRLR